MGRDRCTATTRAGEQCRAPRVKGALVCRVHGGAAPQVQRAAAGRVVEEEARRTFGRLADHAVPVADPFTALALMAGEVVAWKDFCAGRIADLRDLSSTDEKGAEQIDAEIALFERALDRCVSTLAAIAKLDIDARLARIDQMRADAVVRAVEAGIAAAGISDRAQVTHISSVVARELRRTS